MFNGESPYDSLLDVCVASAMTSCRNLSSEQLEKLLLSDSQIDAIIQSLPQVRSMPSEREVGLTENKTLAEWNLAQEPRITQLRSQVKTTSEAATLLKNEVEGLKSKIDGDASSRSLDTTSNLLQVAAQEADDDAESLAREFYDGNIAADLFVNDFLKKKTLAHSRKIKSDRLVSLLREQQYSQPQVNNHMNYPKVPTGAPYPDIQANPRHAFF